MRSSKYATEERPTNFTVEYLVWDSALRVLETCPEHENFIIQILFQPHYITYTVLSIIELN